MFNSVMFSSQRLDWQTPKALYDVLDKEFAFDFDPNAGRKNTMRWENEQ